MTSTPNGESGRSNSAELGAPIPQPHPGDALGEWAQSMRSKGDGAKVIDLLQAIDDWMVVCHQQESQVERLEAALTDIGTDCRYEIDERRCASESHPTPRAEWCGGCIAWAALSGSERP